MRRHRYVVEGPERALLGKRLAGRHVQSRTAKVARGERAHQCIFHYHLATGDVDEKRAGLHSRKGILVQEAAGLGGQRTTHSDHIRGLQELIESVRSPHFRDFRGRLHRIAVNGLTLHAEGFRSACHGATRAPETDDAHDPPGELDLVEAHLGAMVPAVRAVGERGLDLTCERKQEAKAGVCEMLADEPLFARQNHIAFDELGIQEHIDPRRDGVHPSELGRGS